MTLIASLGVCNAAGDRWFRLQTYFSALFCGGLVCFTTGQLEAFVDMFKALVTDPDYNNDPGKRHCGMSTGQNNFSVFLSLLSDHFMFSWRFTGDPFACKPAPANHTVWWKWGNDSNVSGCAGRGWDENGSDVGQPFAHFMAPNLYCWEHLVPDDEKPICKWDEVSSTQNGCALLRCSGGPVTVGSVSTSSEGLGGAGATDGFSSAFGSDARLAAAQPHSVYRYPDRIRRLPHDGESMALPPFSWSLAHAILCDGLTTACRFVDTGAGAAGAF